MQNIRMGVFLISNIYSINPPVKASVVVLNFTIYETLP
jgi:hypothetical protein